MTDTTKDKVPIDQLDDNEMEGAEAALGDNRKDPLHTGKVRNMSVDFIFWSQLDS